MRLPAFLKPFPHLVVTGLYLLISIHLTAQPIAGLVAYWPMDGNFTDNGPNNIVVTNTNATGTTNAGGTSNAAMNFVNTGTNATQYASQAINSSVNFSGSNNSTYDFLLYYTSPDKSGGLYDNNINYFGSGMYIWYSNNFMQLQFNYKNGSVGSTNGALQLNTWTHITCTRSAGVLSIYINGVLNATGNEGSQIPSYTYTAKFGTQWFNASPYFNYNGLNGKMDEFRIYNRALTPEEISQLQCLYFPAAAPLINVTGDTTICAGQTVLLNSSATSGNQWYQNNVIQPGATGQSLQVSNSGVYTVISSSGGCLSAPSNPVTITVSPNPQLGNDTIAKLLCPGGSINLDNIFNTGGLTTSWSTPDPQHATAGAYTVLASNNAGCRDTASVIVMVETATWTGVLSTDWYTGGNWSTGQIPSEKTHVIINSVTPNQCTINAGTPAVASIQLKNGAVLQLLNSSRLTVAGTCSNLPVN